MSMRSMWETAFTSGGSLVARAASRPATSDGGLDLLHPYPLRLHHHLLSRAASPVVCSHLTTKSVWEARVCRCAQTPVARVSGSASRALTAATTWRPVCQTDSTR